MNIFTNYSHNTYYQNTSLKVKNSGKTFLNLTCKKLDKDKFDYSKDDGKISPLNKLKNFVKGIISPVTNMFKSPKNFLLGIGAIAGGAALIAATGGAAAPVLVALGVMGGTVQLGVSAYKASTAKTDKEAEDAWLGLGAGTSAVVGSVAGAKSALKASGVDSGKMNSIQATIQCFKNLPKSLANSFNAFKSGAVLTNLKNMFVKTKPDVEQKADEIQKVAEPKELPEAKPLTPEEAYAQLKSKSSEVSFDNLDPETRSFAQKWWKEITQRCNESASYDDLTSSPQFDFAKNFDAKSPSGAQNASGAQNVLKSQSNALDAVKNEYCKLLRDYNKAIGNNDMLVGWGDDGKALFTHFEGKSQFTDPKRISSIQRIMDSLFGDEYNNFSQNEKGFSSVTKSLFQRLKNSFDNNSTLVNVREADGAQLFESVLDLGSGKNIKIYRLNLPDNKFVYCIAQNRQKGVVIIDKDAILSIMNGGSRYLDTVK